MSQLIRVSAHYAVNENCQDRVIVSRELKWDLMHAPLLNSRTFKSTMKPHPETDFLLAIATGASYPSGKEPTLSSASVLHLHMCRGPSWEQPLYFHLLCLHTGPN